jgi:hypothetical protein
MLKKYFSMFFLAALLSGCLFAGGIKGVNLNNCGIFQKYIDVQTVLKRDVGYVKQHDLNYYELIDLSDPLYRIAKERNVNTSRNVDVGVIKSGSMVVIDSVYIDEIYAGPTVVVASGKINSERFVKDIFFKYIWSHTYEIDRAPWDDSSVAETRKILLGENGNCDDQ